MMDSDERPEPAKFAIDRIEFAYVFLSSVNKSDTKLYAQGFTAEQKMPCVIRRSAKTKKELVVPTPI